MRLAARDISKAFPGVQALRGVTFELAAGEVHALIGENGAGKSTLIRVITGAEKPDTGTVTVDDQPLGEADPRAARTLGIAAIYQQPQLFAELTVAENLALGREPGGLLRRVDWRRRRDDARALLARVGARIDPAAKVAALSMPQQQLVEIARAIGAQAKVLIMDEPTACLPEADVAGLFGVIRELRDQGVGIVYISHRLDELFEIADRVTVLRDGEKVGTAPIGEVDRARLIGLMVGRELSAVYPARAGAPGEVVLSARGLTCAAVGIEGVDLDLRAGEIVGLAGLVGSGRTELARVLFGLEPADGGTVTIAGRGVVLDSPAAAIAAGLAYLPEDRRRHGIVAPMGVAENVGLAVLPRLVRGPFLDTEAELRLAAEYAGRLDLRAASLHVAAGTLSGGNQQKVALARWLAAEPLVILADEPTQGIDVGAKAEIHKLLCDLADTGRAVLLISSELPEVLGMSDRILVMRGGRLVAELPRGSSQEAVLTAALGAQEAA